MFVISDRAAAGRQAAGYGAFFDNVMKRTDEGNGAKTPALR